MKPARFLFAGHAVGAAGQIIRVENNRNLDLRLPIQASCALPVTGGFAEVEAKRFKLPFEANGKKYSLFSGDRAVGRCCGFDKNTRAETSAGVEVEGLTVCDKRLVIGSMKADVKSIYPFADDAIPSFEIGADTGFQSVQIGKVKLNITLDTAVFKKWKTFASETDMRERHGKLFGKLEHKLEHNFSVGYYQTTIVKKITAEGSEKDKAEIEIHGNMVSWKELGKVYFGELYVSKHARRLLMVRLAMGSPSDGSGGAGEVGTNGSGGN